MLKINRTCTRFLSTSFCAICETCRKLGVVWTSALHAEAHAVGWCRWHVCPLPSFLIDLHLGKKKMTLAVLPCPLVWILPKQERASGWMCPSSVRRHQDLGAMEQQKPPCACGEVRAVCVWGGHPPLGLFCGSTKLVEVKPSVMKALGMLLSTSALQLWLCSPTHRGCLAGKLSADRSTSWSFNGYFWFYFILMLSREFLNMHWSYWYTDKFASAQLVFHSD